MENRITGMNSNKSFQINSSRLVGMVLFWAMGILISSCDSGKRSVSEEDLGPQIHTLIIKYHKAGKFNGTVLIADSNQVVYQGAFGWADREKDIDLTIQSQFYLASVSKQFTAAALMKLFQDKKAAPDDEIMYYLPELPSVYQRVTIRHLLHHTSGIPDYYDFSDPWEGFTNSDVLNELKNVKKLQFEPGSRHKYSNSGYVLLSILVSKISGISFADYMNKNFFNTFGMSQTVVYDESADEPEYRVIGYGKDGSLTDYRFRTTGGGGIFSNIEDLYQWHLSLLSGKILSDEVLSQAYSPAILKNEEKVYYGFGWDLDPKDSCHVWHGGDLEGFRTWYDRRLDDGKVIILLSNNSSEHLEKISKEIWRLWINPTNIEIKRKASGTDIKSPLHKALDHMFYEFFFLNITSD